MGVDPYVWLPPCVTSRLQPMVSVIPFTPPPHLSQNSWSAPAKVLWRTVHLENSCYWVKLWITVLYVWISSISVTVFWGTTFQRVITMQNKWQIECCTVFFFVLLALYILYWLIITGVPFEKECQKNLLRQAHSGFSSLQTLHHICSGNFSCLFFLLFELL